MNEAGHQQRALDLEQSVRDLGDPVASPHICALALEAYWGASFHWIVVGCIRKHAWHTDSHSGLSKQLKQRGEMQIAALWDKLEAGRTGGFYTYQATSAEVARAQQCWQEIRAWATN